VNRRGFTIVELLIVIVVIGILAAITIVAYNGISSKARVASLQSDLENSNKQLIAYLGTSSTGYPTALDCSASPAANTICLKSSAGTSYQYSVNNSANPPTYCLTATNGTTSYFFGTNYSNPASGGCPGHGVGGVAAITNMAIDPGAETDVSGATYSSNASTSRSTTWSAGGTASYDITPNNSSNNDSFFSLGGDQGAFRLGFQPGNTYTISATVHLAAAQTGTLAGNGARQITAWYTNGSITLIKGTQAPNAAGDTRVSVTFTIPSTATSAWVRFYDGAYQGNGDVWYDNIMITQGSTIYNYADGNTTNWVWNGATNNSTSTGPPQ